jgi:uncharacterized membrane protein YtjA (UPF0391 family)
LCAATGAIGRSVGVEDESASAPKNARSRTNPPASTSHGKCTRRHGCHPLRCAKSHQATSVEESIMLSYAVTFLIIAIIAALLGFTGIAGAAGNIAYILAIVFVILFIASLLFGRRGRI